MSRFPSGISIPITSRWTGLSSRTESSDRILRTRKKEQEGGDTPSCLGAVQTRLALLQKCKQVLVDYICMCSAETVRRTGNHIERCVFHDLSREVRSILDRNNLIGISLKNQGRHLNLLEVLGKIRF